ncbi:TetR family transcriptional regulator [Sorangium cellulosum]|uniref:TetR family transcriptional regulator n=1 Tax=Sorangium cellulosum TaxID=56 RepID=A0A4P2PXN2_SORCE|nr:TetR/AcrR family transcriptional regulator [Sorangium cellulosum]AUX21253.1 TetR family transcriptional regulator [Sorangium cellulosum]
MVRTVLKADERRSQILDAARALFMRRGYDATTINDILAATRLSKGAFYHHFSSKAEVLDALCARMAHEGLSAASRIFERTELGPVERLQLFFAAGSQYKDENAAALKAVLCVLYRDENLRLRLSVTERTIELIAPRLAEVLAEGRASGVFEIDDPAETARLILHLGRMVHDAFAAAMRLPPAQRAQASALCRARVDTYERAIERVLGVARDRLTLVAPSMIERFLDAPAPDLDIGKGAES